MQMLFTSCSAISGKSVYGPHSILHDQTETNLESSDVLIKPV